MNITKIVNIFGIKGFYLYFCRRMKRAFSPVNVPVFGRIRTLHEVRNIFDNFGDMAQMRDAVVEKCISGKKEPVIIDCGVNVGITIRWWFHLNPGAKVYGIDMIEEAQEFTAEALKSLPGRAWNYRPMLTALGSENGKEITIGVDDPLEGDNNLRKPAEEGNSRVVTTRTLDTIFINENIGEVDLLKIDLENAGADTLTGAEGLLKKTRHVVFETHTQVEETGAKKILSAAGFVLRRTSSRSMWWDRV